MSEEAATAPGVQRRWRFILLVGGWTLVGLLFVAPVIARALTELRPIPWPEVFSELLDWYIWGLLFPVIWWVVRSFPLERKGQDTAQRFAHGSRWLLVNLVLGLSITLVFKFLSLTKNDLIHLLAFGDTSFPQLHTLPDGLFEGLIFNLPVYFILVAVIHAASYYEKFRERELRASRLETQLALAQLQVLKMQLHPHFLFNTLNAISALMHRDVDAADRMIASLSDLLRLSLEKDDRHQVPLKSELEFLDRYLAIEKIRFRDRLSVEMDIEPKCLDAQVPKLVLQPLVENSIRHGIAMRSAAGRVSIRARRKGYSLCLDIADDGPGLPANRKGGMREGVGLANTRARLEQLYGADHDLQLRDAEIGGLEVHIEIPFERRARFRTESAVNPTMPGAGRGRVSSRRPEPRD